MAKQEWARIAKRDEIQLRLSAWIDEEIQAAIRQLPEDELADRLAAIIASPISFKTPHWADWTTAQNVAEEVDLFERIGLRR